jgi:predicted enzyme related to lactoylglutathione lyase
MDHTIIHFEIPAKNVETLKRFYAGLFGWKIEKYPGPMEYWMIQTVPVDEKGMLLRPGVNGGMTKKESPEQKPVNYISVESIDESIEKVKVRWENNFAKAGSTQRWMDSNSCGPRGKSNRPATATAHVTFLPLN